MKVKQHVCAFNPKSVIIFRLRCQGDVLHETSKPIFLENYFKTSAEIFTQHA